MGYRLLISAALLAGACTAPDKPAETSASASDKWMFEAEAEALRAVSCPEGASFQSSDSIEIKVKEIDRGVAASESFSGLSFAGAWHLTSKRYVFGGLSGLDVLPSGTLLTMSDDGRWFWIGIDPQTYAPDGIGAMAHMLGEEGEVVSNKVDKDSEGLAYRDGLALVSFEQDHRIAAFDLEGCGAAARAAPITDLPKIVDGKRLPDNRGGEALSLMPDGALRLGFESSNGQGAVTATLKQEGSLTDLSYDRVPMLYRITGLDIEGETSAKVFRSYDPVRGPRVIVSVLQGGAEIARADLKGALPVDNFEGIAIGQGPGGATRIWLISDNNFNPQQRTLLFAFDLES